MAAEARRAQQRGPLDGDDQPQVGPVEEGDELRGEEDEHQVVPSVSIALPMPFTTSASLRNVPAPMP
jgi:hypothetical protein